MRQLPTRSGWFFDRFVRAADRTHLVNDDWVRFYQFVQACHEGGLEESDRQIGRRLGALSFAPPILRKLRAAYFHGRRQLKSRVMLHNAVFCTKQRMRLPLVDLTKLGRS